MKVSYIGREQVYHKIPCFTGEMDVSPDRDPVANETSVPVKSGQMWLLSGNRPWMFAAEK